MYTKTYTRTIHWKGRIFEVYRATPEAARRDYILKLRWLAESDPKRRSVQIRAA